MLLILVNHVKQSKYMYSEIVTRKFKMATKMATKMAAGSKIGISKMALSHLKMHLE